jgi:hypothetical protein
VIIQRLSAGLFIVMFLIQFLFGPSAIPTPDRRDLAGRLANRVQLTTDGHHIAAVALHFMYYNFIKTHYLPAVAAGVVSSPLEVADIVRMMEERNAQNNKAQREEPNERSYNPFGDALGSKGLPK